MPTFTGINIDRQQKLQKYLSPLYSGPLVYVEFQISSKPKLLQLLLRTVAWKMTGANIGSYHIGQASRIAKKLLLLLNSSPSISVKYEMSSKLKHLPFLFQNYGLKIDRYQYWQAEKITKRFCHHWIQGLRFI